MKNVVGRDTVSISFSKCVLISWKRFRSLFWVVKCRDLKLDFFWGKVSFFRWENKKMKKQKKKYMKKIIFLFTVVIYCVWRNKIISIFKVNSYKCRSENMLFIVVLMWTCMLFSLLLLKCVLFSSQVPNQLHVFMTYSYPICLGQFLGRTSLLSCSIRLTRTKRGKLFFFLFIIHTYRRKSWL